MICIKSIQFKSPTLDLKLKVNLKGISIINYLYYYIDSNYGNTKVRIFEEYFKNSSPHCSITKETATLIECICGNMDDIRGKTVEVIVYNENSGSSVYDPFKIFLSKKITICLNPSTQGDNCTQPYIQCQDNCYNGGECDTTTGVCICENNFQGKSCLLKREQCPTTKIQVKNFYNTINNSNTNTLETAQCSGYGICDDRYGACICNSDRVGPDCSKTKCKNSDCYPFIDSIVPASSKSSEIIVKGWFSNWRCDDVIVDGISDHSYQLKRISDTSISLKTYKENYQPLLNFTLGFTCSKYSNKITLVTNYQSCNSTSQGENCSEPYKECPSYCNNRGDCTKNGTCNCFKGYGGDGCQFTIPQQCPTNDPSMVKQCSGFGTCNAITGLCECEPNTTGSDCSKVKCTEKGCYPFVESIIPASILGGQIQINGWFDDQIIKGVQLSFNNTHSFGSLKVDKFNKTSSYVLNATLPDISSNSSITSGFFKISVVLSNDTFEFSYYPCNSTSFGINCSSLYHQCPVDVLGNICGGSGECNPGTGVCNCNNGVENENCSMYKTCPSNYIYGGQCSGNGICDIITGKCDCTTDRYGKLMIGEDCSISNHSIYSIWQPNYDHGEAVLNGNFGYINSNLSVTVGGLDCPILKTHRDEITIKLPPTITGGFGIVNYTVSVYQNGINSTSIHSFKSIDSQCPRGVFHVGDYDTTVVCGKRGTCLDDGKCQCFWNEWTGYDCSTPKSFKIQYFYMSPSQGNGVAIGWIFNFENVYNKLTIAINGLNCKITSISGGDIRCLIIGDTTGIIYPKVEFYQNKNFLIYNETLTTPGQAITTPSPTHYYTPSSTPTKQPPKGHFSNNNNNRVDDDDDDENDTLSFLKFPSILLLFIFSILLFTISIIVYLINYLNNNFKK